MKKRSFILLGTIVFFAGMALMQAALQAVPTIMVKLTASQSSLTAYCPATITFTGAIKVDNVIKAPVAIQYKFVRSDGSSTAPITLNCPGAGVFPVKHSWTLSDTYSGWEALEVISPVSVKSEKATFILTCLPKPWIDPDYLNTKLTDWATDTEFQIIGNNLGTDQGNKNVTLDGQPVLPKRGWSVMSWAPWEISLKIRSCDIIIWDHEYKIAITDGGQVVSNVVPMRFRYQITVHGGQLNYYAGQDFTVEVSNLPPSQSGYSLKWPFDIAYPIQHWTGAVGCTRGTITATIPKGAHAGHHLVFLYKGNTLVSDDGTYINVVIQPVIKK